MLSFSSSLSLLSMKFPMTPSSSCARASAASSSSSCRALLYRLLRLGRKRGTIHRPLRSSLPNKDAGNQLGERDDVDVIVIHRRLSALSLRLRARALTRTGRFTRITLTTTTTDGTTGRLCRTVVFLLVFIAATLHSSLVSSLARLPLFLRDSLGPQITVA